MWRVNVSRGLGPFRFGAALFVCGVLLGLRICMTFRCVCLSGTRRGTCWLTLCRLRLRVLQ